MGRSSKSAPNLPPAVEVQTRLGPLLFPRGDGVMRPLMASTGDWELNEAMLFRAHVGYYTLLSARAVGWRGRVIAVEPDPDNAALLRENIRRNRLHNVTVVQAAAWRETARVPLRRDPVNTGDNRILLGIDGYEVP